MKEVVIKVKNLGKSYNLSDQRQTLVRKFLNLNKSKAKVKPFWALKNINFEVYHGEIVGVIGANGAGKSTLFKILSRITTPSKGTVQIRGRVSSLLEIGTGFNPELSGRENIYLNGAILGMSRKEIEQKFSQIVEFAEIGEFLDTPVKHYSSGMYVRLAFAVAAHLESEILLIDEVLAVGDVRFQRKCLDKTEQLRQSDRTIMVISHSMATVKKLCDRIIVLEKGKIVFNGPSDKAIHRYLEDEPQKPTFVKTWDDPKTAPQNDCVMVRSISLTDSEGKQLKSIDIDTPFDIRIDYKITKPSKIGFNLIFYDEEGGCILASLSNQEKKIYPHGFDEGDYQSVCHIPSQLFNNSTFNLTLGIFKADYKSLNFTDNVLRIEFKDAPGVRGDYHGTYASRLRPKFVWETHKGKNE